MTTVETDVLRESSRWRKEKTPLLLKYIVEHSKVLDEIASRGFRSLPGYAYDMENELELMTKLGLSELNYKIMTETIERELKQMGIDYGLAYRNAVMVWELEKQTLLASWASEYAGIQQGMMNDENVLNVLANEVRRRELALMSGKLAIEIAMEADRKTLTDIDGETAPYEVQLAQARMLVAEKKLDLIPILQEIVTKEQSLLAQGQLKAAAYTSYIAAEGEIAVKKQTLVPILSQLAALTQSYTQDILNIEIPDLALISAEKVKQANISIEKANYQVQELTVEIDTETKKLTLMDAKRALEILQFTNEELLITITTSLDTQYHIDEMTEFNTLYNEEQSAETTVLQDRLEAHKTALAASLTSMGTMTTEEKNKNYDVTQAEIKEIREKATLDAAPKITAALEHIIK